MITFLAHNVNHCRLRSLKTTHEQIAIWDRALTPQEMQAVSSYFMSYLANGGKTLSLTCLSLSRSDFKRNHFFAERTLVRVWLLTRCRGEQPKVLRFSPLPISRRTFFAATAMRPVAKFKPPSSHRPADVITVCRNRRPSAPLRTPAGLEYVSARLRV